MRFRSTTVAAAAALAAFLVPAVASPAAAATEATRSVSRSWGAGEATFAWKNPYRIERITISAKDRADDGYAVGVRVITNSDKKGTYGWRMRKVTGGAGASKSWTTYLHISDKENNINWAKLQLCLLDEEGKVVDCRETIRSSSPRM